MIKIFFLSGLFSVWNLCCRSVSDPQWVITVQRFSNKNRHCSVHRGRQNSRRKFLTGALNLSRVTYTDLKVAWILQLLCCHFKSLHFQIQPLRYAHQMKCNLPTGLLLWQKIVFSHFFFFLHLGPNFSACSESTCCSPSVYLVELMHCKNKLVCHKNTTGGKRDLSSSLQFYFLRKKENSQSHFSTSIKLLKIFFLFPGNSSKSVSIWNNMKEPETDVFFSVE